VVGWTLNSLKLDAHAVTGSFTLTVTAIEKDAEGNLSTSATATEALTVAPAGIAGSPINLALASVSGPQDGTYSSVMVSGIPLGATLTDGSHTFTSTLGNTSVDVHSWSLAQLAITTPSTFTGAIVLNVSETWSQSNGATTNVQIADNVEAYSPGSPIFAWSGADNLTGSAAADTFVFDHLIGTDTIYNFDPAHDKIDLIGFANRGSFADLQGSIATDVNGNAVITLGNGETITLVGVTAASLNANDFLFNQTPDVHNAGTMTIGNGAFLPLDGIIDNSGTIALGAAGAETDLQIGGSGLTLLGGGKLTLSDSPENVVIGSSPDATLTNVDNVIVGAGQLGSGEMTLINEGTIIASGHNPLLIDTGLNVISNSGVLESANGGELEVHSDVLNSGLVWANGGHIVFDGSVTGQGSATIGGAGVLEFGGASSEKVSFEHGSGGTLQLDNPGSFTGVVSGFGANDQLDLRDISYGPGATLHYTPDRQGTGGELAISDGTHTTDIMLLGHYTAENFQVTADDGAGSLVSYVPAVGFEGSAHRPAVGVDLTGKVNSIDSADLLSPAHPLGAGSNTNALLTGQESWADHLHPAVGVDGQRNTGANWIEAIDLHSSPASGIAGVDWVHAVTSQSVTLTEPGNHTVMDSWQHANPISHMPEMPNTHPEETHRPM
jgi:hypothetical protein